MENNKLIPLILVIFAIVCFITSSVLNANQGKGLTEKISPEGGTVGPIVVDKAKTVYNISVQQSIGTSGDWSTVLGQLLDENQNYLFSFGRDFYYETGYDSDGYWSEGRTRYNMKVTMPKAGNYYLNFEVEKSPGVISGITVRVEKKAGSSIPFNVAGYLSVIAAVIAAVVLNKARVKKMVNRLEFD